MVFRLKASWISSRSLTPIRRFSRSMTPVIMVMMPSPPTWISTRITTCPNRLQVVAVGTVTRPVTQVAVVAVNRASMYGTACPSAELTGNESKMLPMNMVIKKPSRMICVVDRDNFFFIISNTFSSNN